MSVTVSNVTAGKPKASGYVYFAPVGTTLPTDATTALGSSFVDLGGISEDGMTKNISMDSTEIKEWGGLVVLVTDDGKTETYKFDLIEYLNVNVQKFVHGDSAVTGTSITGGVAIASGDDELTEKVIVFEQVMRGGVPHRIVVPRAKITEIGDIPYKRNEAVKIPITITAIADASGKKSYEYYGGTSGT